MSTFTCPHCSQSLELPEDVAGKSVRCAKCQQTFDLPGSSAMKSGEPPARSGTETGVTDNAPSAKAPAEPDSRDLPPPRERRDIEKSSPLVPIAIIAGVVLLGLCVCGGPVVLFLGFIPFRMVHDEERVQQARKAEVAADHAHADEAVMEVRGRAEGVAEAQISIAKETLLLKEYPPLPAPAWHSDYIKLLKEKCNCDYQVVNTPKYSKEVHDEVNGWNDTMKAEIRRRPGGEILDQLQDLAQQRWKERIEAKGKKQ